MRIMAGCAGQRSLGLPKASRLEKAITGVIDLELVLAGGIETIEVEFVLLQRRSGAIRERLAAGYPERIRKRGGRGLQVTL
jgi:hypothetical protein